MKKGLLIVLLVLLTLTMFVGCDGSVNLILMGGKKIKLSFIGGDTPYEVELNVSGYKTFGDLGTDFSFDVEGGLITFTYTDDIETENGFYFSYNDTTLNVYSDESKTTRCNKNTIIENGKTYYGSVLT